jgi:hypothetical protein
MDAETIKKLHFPETFDISPKEITTPINTIHISVGDRDFVVCPDVGKFTAITMNQKNLELGVCALFSFTKEYGKDKKLPELLLKLWNTQKGP